LARDVGELAANYQDAVKGVLTLSRPATMGRRKRGFGFPAGEPASCGGGEGGGRRSHGNSRFEDPAI
jgi:hypothetical protein